MGNGLEKLIKDVTRGLKEKTDFSGRWCPHYTEECDNKMREYAKTEHLCEHKCEYCDTFKFAIDRAKEYAKTCEKDYEEILDAWEENRSYWFLNYYQEANQPSIGKVDLIIDKPEDLRKLYGAKGFRCPCCGGASSDPQTCDTGITVKDYIASNAEHACNWCSYGFISSTYHVFVKSVMRSIPIFKPMQIWEAQEHITIHVSRVQGKRKYNITVCSDRQNNPIEETSLMKTAKEHLINKYKADYGWDCVKVMEE